MNKIGSLILGRRKALKKTQIEVAKELGVKPQFLGKIEKGEVPLPWERVPVLCRELNLKHKAITTALTIDFENKLKDQISTWKRRSNC